MPWKLLTPMSQRKELVSLVLTDGANMARLCRRFEISRKIGYKWLARYRAMGEAGLADRSRRPHRSPGETKEALVAAEGRRAEVIVGGQGAEGHSIDGAAIDVLERGVVTDGTAPRLEAWATRMVCHKMVL